MSSRAIPAALAGLLVIGLLVVLAWRLASAYSVLNQPVDFSQLGFVGSAVCADCHDSRHGSWYSTYHRTMTQEAGVHSVQGQFDGRNLDYQGIRVRPVREGGRFFFDYFDLESGDLINRLQVHRTVGSHRYQQYLTRLPEDGTFVRLHYLWHNGDQRWVHMNAAFLGPDGRSFDAEVAIWNQNCIFCHNTGPQPRMTNYETLQARARAGEPVDVSRDARFESTVAELGIACESCHGPGEAHVARAQDGWQRMAMHLWAGRDASIVNPVRLDAKRASHVCAQCHAARMPPDVASLRAWMDTGPSFRPGDSLYEHVQPLTRASRAPIAGQEDMFALRFWADGTPRLTAYEYQGLALSACYQEAHLSCMDCHSMHAGDPSGQLTDRNRGNAPCLRCHQDFRRETQLVAHTQHPASSPGSLCYNCHMPHLKYGVMDIHRSHRIEVPDARRDALAGRPNACLNCHVEKTHQWAAELLASWYEPGQAAIIPWRRDGGPMELSELSTVLLGDPVQKAVLAWRAGQADLSQRGRERAWMLTYLIEAMDDIYPATRRFSTLSFRAILDDWPEPEEVAELKRDLASFDFMADDRQRTARLTRIRASWEALDKSDWPLPPGQSAVTPDFRLPADLRDQLVELGRRQDKQISIGE